MPKIQNQITMRKVCIVIQSLVSLVQITIRATARIARNTISFSPWNGGRRCLRRNQRQAVQAVWVRYEPSTPRRDPKTGELARSSRRRAQPFLLGHCRSEGNQVCLPGPLWSSSRIGVTHSVQVTRWARTRSCSRSSIQAPSSSESGSPPRSSRAAR